MLDRAPLVGEAKERLTKLRYAAAEMAFRLALIQTLLDLKAGFDPNQPRVPAGLPEGGQWTDADGPFGEPLLDLREYGGL